MGPARATRGATSRAGRAATCLPARSATDAGPDRPQRIELLTDLQRASRALVRGNHTVAEDALRSVVQRAPEMASAWFQLALALRCQQKGAEALVAVERALQADRALTDAKLLHVELLATVAPERARPVIKEEDQ